MTSHQVERPASAARVRRVPPVLVVLLAADMAFAFQQTGVIPAIPTIERDLGMSQAWGAWLLSGYLLVASVATPLVGRLADRYGKRRMLLVALAAFLAGSVGAAVSPGTVPLICCRALQGIGGAVFPLSMSIVRDELPPRRVGPAIGTLTGGFGIGTAAGVGLSGVLTAVSWRLVFGVGAVVIAGCGIAVLVVLAHREAATAEPVDLAGATLMGGALTALLVALTLGPGTGWGAPVIWILLAAAAACVWWWVRHETRTDSPLIGLSLLRSPPVLWTNLATVLAGFALFGSYYLVPHVIENPKVGVGGGVIAAGLYLLPAAVGQLVGGPVFGSLHRRGIAAKWPFLGGMTVAAVGLLVLIPGLSVPVVLVCGMFLLGIGIGLVISSSSTLVTQGVPADRTGVSTAVNSTMRRVGGGIGGQVIAALLVAFPAARAGGPDGYVVGLLVGAGVCLLGAALAARAE